jgi:hypothetical protein
VTTGTWKDAYAKRGRKFTATHLGGPADGASLTITGSPLPQARFYAPTAERKLPRVQLARYVLHVMPEIGKVIYLHTGQEEREGPVPGQKDSPAWSL